MPWGVGVIGAGPGVAALHLPDARNDWATSSRSSTSPTTAAAAPRSSPAASAPRHRREPRRCSRIPPSRCVAICSPPGEHARQIREGVAAGVRAILCEKPLATTTEEAREVVDACREAGVVLLVATNHFYDEAWDRAKHHLVALQSDVRTISATVALPPNGRYHAAVTELAAAGAPAAAAPDLADPERRGGRSSGSSCSGSPCTTSRPCATWRPTSRASTSPRPSPPIGYTVGFRASGVRVLLTAVMLPDGPDPVWRLTIGTSTDRVDVEFPPSFVHAGSATVRVRTGDLRTTTYRRERRGRLRARVAGAGRAPRRDGHHGVPRGPRRCDLRDRPRRRGGRGDPRGSTVVNARIPVVADLPDYVVAVAGLPAAARSASIGCAGAIVVVDGATRVVGCRGAGRGRRGRPRCSWRSRTRCRSSRSRELAARASGVPILVHRARLRDDLVAVADRATRRRRATGRRRGVPGARRRDLPAMVRDAVGWMRALADDRLVVAVGLRRRRAAPARRSCAPAPTVASSAPMLAAVTRPEARCSACRRWARRPPRSRSTHRSAGRSSPRAPSEGAWVAPRRFETGERAALRRAVECGRAALGCLAGPRSTCCTTANLRPPHPSRASIDLRRFS